MRGLAVILLIAATALTLFACNPPAEDVITEYGVYITDFTHDIENSSTIVHLAFTTEEEKYLDGITCPVEIEWQADAWWDYTTTIYTLPSAEIVRAVEAETSVSDRTDENGVYYPGVRVVLEWDTLYKNLISNGEVAKLGKVYRHIFALDGGEEVQDFMVLDRTPYKPAWYGLAVGIAVALLLAVAVASQFKKPKIRIVPKNETAERTDAQGLKENNG
jgi:hypothetical protein